MEVLEGEGTLKLGKSNYQSIDASAVLSLRDDSNETFCFTHVSYFLFFNLKSITFKIRLKIKKKHLFKKI